MNVDSVFRYVDAIRASAGDPEAAHGMEDELYTEVLASIALGNPNGRELAAAALHAQDVDFPRWTA